MSTYHVANLDDLPVGSKKLVSAGKKEVLICNVDGEVSALHPKCSHFGAPLIDGVLNGHRLVCPWHHACFDALSGRHLESLGCDAIKAYPVEVKGKEIWVEIPENASGETQHPNPMAAPQQSDGLPYVIIGGGAAGAAAIEGLRQGGYAGAITLISAEEHLPYDRTQVSKGFLTGDQSAKKMLKRSKKFYQDLGVDLLLGNRVKKIDGKTKIVTLEQGDKISFEKACVATGSSPRKLNIEGADLPDIFTLRNWEDAEQLNELAKDGKQVAIIGASFIGLEAAMALAKLGCEVTVIAPEDVPFGNIFGKRIGRQIQAWQEELGINFLLGEEVNSFEGVRKVTGVNLKSGKTIRAHFAVIGIGVIPNTDIFSDLKTDKKGGIPVDEFQYAGNNIWVAGDIATAPQLTDGSPARIEHWRVAEQQGTIAGNNMAGVKRPLRSIPYFWTNQAGKNIRYAGHHSKTDNIVFDGQPEDAKFIAFYIEGDAVKAALGVGRDQEIAAIHELMWLNEMPKADELKMNTKCVELLAKHN